MKVKMMITGVFSLVAIAAFAQKDVTTAQGEYSKYSQFKSQKGMGAIALASLNNAKAAIDKASANEKTASLPLTYAVKAAVYGSLAFNDTVSATSAPLFATAEAAVKKAKELDSKGENKKLIDDANLNLAQSKLNEGVKEYGEKRYDLAYKSFDYSRQIMSDDTTIMFYTGLAAANANNTDAAIENYNRLLKTNYSKKEGLYQDLSNIYFARKDTAMAIKMASEGSEKYPKNSYLSQRAIELTIQSGKLSEVVNQLDAAIARDPKNKTMYYYAAFAYTKIADDANNKIAKAKDAAQTAALTKIRDDYFTKAEAADKKALEIDPNYFEAVNNMGFILSSPAIDTFNATRKLPASKQKEFDAGMAKTKALFETAKPYLLKAADLNPKSVEALYNLRAYYQGTNDLTNANITKKKIDALQAEAK